MSREASTLSQFLLFFVSAETVNDPVDSFGSCNINQQQDKLEKLIDIVGAFFSS